MKKTVFVVDDNDADLVAVAAALEADNRVLTMPSATSMFSLLEKMQPDVIFIQSAMPEVSGFDAIAKLKKNPEHKNIPVILFTGQADDDLLAGAFSAGAVDIMKKPVSDNMLRNAVKKHTSSCAKPCVLVVDDQETSIAELEEILSSEYIVLEAENGNIGIREAEKYIPDVILLDILMPDMDGYATIEILRNTEKTKDIPIIFVTSLKGDNDEERGLISGAADYIMKPFNHAIVKLRVDNQMKILNHTSSFDERLRQQELLVRISHNFLTDNRADIMFPETLRMVGEFMDLSKALLFKTNDDGVLKCQGEWLNPKLDLMSHIGEEIEMNEGFQTIIKELVESGDYRCISSNKPAHREALRPYRKSNSIFITTPIYIKGKACALLDFSREDDGHQWNDGELSLAVLLSDIFSGVFERDAIEFDLNVVQKLKEELDIAKDNAERSSRAKSEFLSRMSHEMLTPMNAIMGMMQIAKISGSLDGIKDCLDEIGDASHHMVKLIKNVLDVSGGGSTITFDRAVFVFNTMLDYVLGRVNPEITKKNQSLNMDISPSVPEILIGDERRIAQVMVHLLTNASKFTPENGIIDLDVRIINEENDTITLQFDITDNGIGIAKDQQEIIFDIFEQMDGSISRKQDGIGVGLALSKLIVEMMGGRIWLDSEPGKGSKFYFTCEALKVISNIREELMRGRDNFPVEVNAVKMTPDVSVSEAAPAASKLLGKRILVVDDIIINRKVVGSLLRQKGAEVVEAKDGREAVDSFYANPEGIDLILMDIAMPKMDGYEATKMIRSAGLPKAGTVPIVALTAHGDDEHIDAAYACGMDFHLEKPIEPHVLFYTLGRYLE